jgi:hypothetical protein
MENATRSGPRPEDTGFGRRFIAAISFGSVLDPVNSSITAVALVSAGTRSTSAPLPPRG